MNLVDNFRNKITMYRLVLYYLVLLLALAFFFGLFGILPQDPANLAFSTILILATCALTNFVFARVFRAMPNTESVYITAFILALIISPIAPTNTAAIGFLIFASAWAMASKYIFALGKKHIFNPAAFGVALLALTIGHPATWWVGGNLPLLPFVFFGGILIARKICRTDLVLVFALAAIITIIGTAHGTDPFTVIAQTVLHSSFFFLAFVMLTEPLTMPPSRLLRIIYGMIVGFFFAPNIHFGSFYFTPEIALLIGNLFVYIVSPKGRYLLTLVGKKEIAADTYEFVFAPDRIFSFRPGQYLEWTLGHSNTDDRGNRRYFTIASSPTEDTVRLGVKFNDPKSSFKQALKEMQVHDTMFASHIAGDFVLPRSKKKKLAFIAGGIGITPFRSMVQYLMDTEDPRQVTLLYSNKTAAEISYSDVFETAEQKIGMKTIYAVTNELHPVPGTYNGMINGTLIAQEIPDYKERLFYISGPHGMVTAFEKTLRKMGVPDRHIKTDYFPGFA